MKIKKGFGTLFLALLAGLLLTAPAGATETGSSQDLVASGDELTKAKAVGVEGMIPVHGQDVADGVYEVEVESSSSMFRVERARLTVSGGSMSAELTLSGTGYTYLYLGTAGEAAKGETSNYIGYTEDEEGKYVYTIPVEALDQAIDCAAFSRKREKWYGREILFLAESLPEGAVLTDLPDYQELRRAAKEKRIEAMREENGRNSDTKDETAGSGENRQREDVANSEGIRRRKETAGSGELARGKSADNSDLPQVWEPAAVDLPDGEYEILLDFVGGSGRSYVESPAVLAVREGRAYARICWSSSHYDYMKAGDQTYFPLKEEGKSVFEIPVPEFDEKLFVVGDTTAMGTPHEITYQLTFYRDSVLSEGTAGAIRKASEGKPGKAGRILLRGAAALLFIALILYAKIRKVSLSIAVCVLAAGSLLAFGMWPKTNSSFPKEEKQGVSDELTYTSSMELEYAREFSVDYYEGGYALITIAGSERYLLVPESGRIPGDLEPDIVILRQPLTNLYLAASAAMDMFVSLDALPLVRFSAIKPEGWYIPQVREAMERGELLYAGKYAAPDYEQILAGHCTLAIENTMIYHTPQVKEQLERFGIPVLVDYSSYEKEPLGRTEWVRLYGLLAGRREEAEKAFASETAAFASVQKDEIVPKTVAFFYITSNGEVNVRKSSDYMPKMIALAGGSYVFEDLGDGEAVSSTVTLQFEEFYEAAQGADYLIYNSTVEGELDSLEALLSQSSLLKNCKAVQEKQVFCTTKNLYQSSMALGTILHDIHEILAGREEKLTYFYKLE